MCVCRIRMCGMIPRVILRVRLHIIRNERIENVGKSQSCMVSKSRIICKQTVLLGYGMGQPYRSRAAKLIYLDPEGPLASALSSSPVELITEVRLLVAATTMRLPCILCMVLVLVCVCVPLYGLLLIVDGEWLTHTGTSRQISRGAVGRRLCQAQRRSVSATIGCCCCCCCCMPAC